MKLKNAIKYLVHPNKLFLKLHKKKMLNWLPDRIFLKKMYKLKMNQPLNLKNPKKFSEKIQWLKLYDRNPKYTSLVDKHAVKEIVTNKIGSEYVIPTLGVWDSFDEIDFNSLPNQFVLKCTHDSGGLVIVKNKALLNKDAARKKINHSLKQNYYHIWREWPYKNVKPRIIAEQFISDNGHVPVDYKVYCFNGEPYKIMLCLDRDKDEPTKFYSFDFNWNLLRHNLRGKAAPENFSLPQPASLKKMYEFSKIFSNYSAFMRVDFYEVNGNLYFGEMTFYPDSGFDSAILPEIDELYGSMLDLKGVR